MISPDHRCVPPGDLEHLVDDSQTLRSVLYGFHLSEEAVKGGVRVVRGILPSVPYLAVGSV